MNIEDKTKFEVFFKRGFDLFWKKENITEDGKFDSSELKNYMDIFMNNEKWEPICKYKNIFMNDVYLFSAIPHPKSEEGKKKIKTPDYFWVKVKKKN